MLLCYNIFKIFCNVFKFRLSNQRTGEDEKKDGERVKRRWNTEKITDEILCGEYNAVYRYVLSLCHDENLASDITQETFLKAMSAKNGFEGQSSLYTWLCAIAKRIFLNKCKKQGREISDESYFEKLYSNESTEESVSEKEAVFNIHRILHEIKEPYKEVFTLRVFGELSFSDIARLFSKSEEWARVTYHRARKMINEKMREDGYYE